MTTEIVTGFDSVTETATITVMAASACPHYPIKPTVIQACRVLLGLRNDIGRTHKVLAIKLVREACTDVKGGRMGLKEAKDVVDLVCDRMDGRSIDYSVTREALELLDRT